MATWCVCWFRMRQVHKSSSSSSWLCAFEMGEWRKKGALKKEKQRWHYKNINQNWYSIYIDRNLHLQHSFNQKWQPNDHFRGGSCFIFETQWNEFKCRWFFDIVFVRHKYAFCSTGRELCAFQRVLLFLLCRTTWGIEVQGRQEIRSSHAKQKDAIQWQWKW